jgi:hypothetical protein
MTEEEDPSLHLTFGRKLIEIRDRYETLTIANDVLIALCFVASSILFFFEPLE